jgi:RNA polymerase sigma-70 factor (ECF subfamily)
MFAKGGAVHRPASVCEPYGTQGARGGWWWGLSSWGWGMGMVGLERLRGMGMAGSSGEDLVARAVGGSAAAAEELFARHAGGVYRLTFGIARDRELAADAAQNALELAFRSLGQFEGRSTFLVWLHRITVNACLDQMRRAGRTASREGRDHRLDHATADSDLAEQLVETEEVFEAMRRLEPNLRAVMVLRYWFDYTHQQTAEILEIPVGTVYTRSARALAHLEHLLKERHVARP